MRVLSTELPGELEDAFARQVGRVGTGEGIDHPEFGRLLRVIRDVGSRKVSGLPVLVRRYTLASAARDGRFVPTYEFAPAHELSDNVWALAGVVNRVLDNLDIHAQRAVAFSVANVLVDHFVDVGGDVEWAGKYKALTPPTSGVRAWCREVIGLVKAATFPGEEQPGWSARCRQVLTCPTQTAPRGHIRGAAGLVGRLTGGDPDTGDRILRGVMVDYSRAAWWRVAAEVFGG